MKKLAYVGADLGGIRLESGLLLGHGATVDVPDPIHAELLARRPGEFEDREPKTKAKKAEGGEG
jgi:hypothetical protein